MGTSVINNPNSPSLHDIFEFSISNNLENYPAMDENGIIVQKIIKTKFWKNIDSKISQKEKGGFPSSA